MEETRLKEIVDSPLESWKVANVDVREMARELLFLREEILARRKRCGSCGPFPITCNAVVWLDKDHRSSTYCANVKGHTGEHSSTLSKAVNLEIK
jgi:hypothetical protein